MRELLFEQPLKRAHGLAVVYCVSAILKLQILYSRRSDSGLLIRLFDVEPRASVGFGEQELSKGPAFAGLLLVVFLFLLTLVF